MKITHYLNTQDEFERYYWRRYGHRPERYIHAIQVRDISLAVFHVMQFNELPVLPCFELDYII